MWAKHLREISFCGTFLGYFVSAHETRDQHFTCCIYVYSINMQYKLYFQVSYSHKIFSKILHLASAIHKMGVTPLILVAWFVLMHLIFIYFHHPWREIVL